MQDETEDFDGRWDELERVVRSETFVKSPRLAALLKHICKRTWDGRTDELSEQQIGIHFFHRPPGFNASEDAIVRGSARHLRKRLGLYYETEGKQNSVHITVPKGGYIARLEMCPAVPAAEQTLLSEKQTHPAQDFTVHQWIWMVSAAFLLAIALAGSWMWRRSAIARSENSNDGPPILWKALFQPNRRTVIVPGDPALNLYTAYKHHSVPLVDYTEQSYQQDRDIQAVSPEGPGLLSKVNAATMADLKLVSELVRVPYREKLLIPDKNVEVRYARDVSAADLHGANLILLGASTFDPWVSVYDKHLDFQLDRGFEHYTFRVMNRAPKPGEEAVVTKGDAQALTIVAFTETPAGNEHVLLVEGSTMGSVYAALHFLFTQRMWQPVISAATVDGKLRDFEVLLKSDFVKDEVSNTRVLSWHVH